MPVGTITNADGQFVLSFDKEFSNDSVQFSMIGYKTLTEPVHKFLPSGNISIALKPETYVLKAVIVEAPDAREIVRKAIENIDINYPNKPFEMDIYFKSAQKIDNQYVSFFDAALYIEDPGYQNTTLYIENINVIQRRNSDYFNKKGFENWADNQNIRVMSLFLAENYGPIALS